MAIEIGFHCGQKSTPAKHKVAALIYFEEGAQCSEVQAILEKLKQELDAGKGPFIEHGIVNFYDPRQGHPVWYIP